jgi:hypothetical protein
MGDVPVRGVVRVKPGVTFTTIAPAGFRLLQAIERAARSTGLDLVITSACDGMHSGPADPHHRGEAYDVRTRGLTEPQKDELVRQIIGGCNDPGEVPPFPLATTPRSCATARFFGFVEAPGTVNEHIHVQLRKGRTYP